MLIKLWYYIFVRGVVYALPFGNSYNMGIEDGICCGQW